MKIDFLLARLRPVQVVGQSLLLLAVRLIYGSQFAQTGYGKLTHLEGTTEFFASLHIPAPHFHAVLVGGVEMIGGSLLMLGLGTRLASVPLAISMVVAYLTAERAEAFKSLDSFTAAAPYQFLLACLGLLVFGPGKVAVDAFLKKHFTNYQCGSKPCAAN
ncbi:MAG: inner membrane protein YphA [Verrucomicrobiota bacterium]